ncbi:hypothetical protein ACE7GA_19345 [Roseomonas sp. CCTCC AB2023176]|uniref:hypothetical protein n=1 Tax=Roseomonas sp. CCTCC AB2023176 TaxID=3342640 RepID=UPI0035DA861B
MRTLLPVAAVVVASVGLVACSVNTGPAPAPAPAAVVAPAPTYVTPAPMAPAGTVIVR